MPVAILIVCMECCQDQLPSLHRYLSLTWQRFGHWSFRKRIPYQRVSHKKSGCISTVGIMQAIVWPILVKWSSNALAMSLSEVKTSCPDLIWWTFIDLHWWDWSSLINHHVYGDQIFLRQVSLKNICIWLSYGAI